MSDDSLKDTTISGWVDEIENIVNKQEKELPKVYGWRKELWRFSRLIKEIKRSRRWQEIGIEVHLRKSLILSAATELKIKLHEDELISAESSRKSNQQPNVLTMAATDVFVEKAQKLLSTRARQLMLGGIATGSIATILLLAGATFLFRSHIDDILKQVLGTGPDNPINGYALTIFMFKTTSASVMGFGAIYVLIAWSRALFHEAMVLYNRRHALRFGRLFVYAKGGEVSLDELETAFKWNYEFTSAFKDIRPEKASRTMLQSSVEVLHEVVEALKTVKTVAASTSEKVTNRRDMLNASKTDYCYYSKGSR
jgi:hypothetical protein